MYFRYALNLIKKERNHTFNPDFSTRVVGHLNAAAVGEAAYAGRRIFIRRGTSRIIRTVNRTVKKRAARRFLYHL